MKLLIDRSFEKDIKKVYDKKIQNLVADCIEEIQLKSKLSELSNCKKLKGSKNCYRIRVGDFVQSVPNIYLLPKIGFTCLLQCVSFLVRVA